MLLQRLGAGTYPRLLLSIVNVRDKTRAPNLKELSYNVHGWCCRRHFYKDNVTPGLCGNWRNTLKIKSHNWLQWRNYHILQDSQLDALLTTTKETNLSWSTTYYFRNSFHALKFYLRLFMVLWLWILSTRLWQDCWGWGDEEKIWRSLGRKSAGIHIKII